MRWRMLAILAVAFSLGAGLYSSSAGEAPRQCVGTTKDRQQRTVASISVGAQIISGLSGSLTATFVLEEVLYAKLYCNCSPCCVEPEWQKARLSAKARGVRLGRQYVWSGEVTDLQEGREGQEIHGSLCNLSVEMTHRVDSELPALDVGSGMGGVSVSGPSTSMISFDLTSYCECEVQGPCDGSASPELGSPTIYGEHGIQMIPILFPGEELVFTIQATDSDGNLDYFAGAESAELLPIELLGTQFELDGHEGTAYFRVRAPAGVMVPISTVMVGVYDRCMLTNLVEFPVCVLAGAPKLAVETQKWTEDRYVVALNVDDPDFHVQGRGVYFETVRLSVNGDLDGWTLSSGPKWGGTYLEETEGVTLFLDPDADSEFGCTLEIIATDAYGATDVIEINVPPALCALNSTVSAKLGSVVELPMGCSNPEAYPDSVATYELSEIDLDGIGSITGSPPNCTLTLLATTCCEEVVIPYTIREPGGAQAHGAVTVEIDRTPRITPVEIVCRPGDTKRVMVEILSCLGSLGRFSVHSDPGTSIQAAAMPSEIEVNQETGATFHPVDVNVFADARPGTYEIPMRIFDEGDAEASLTVVVANEDPVWNPSERATVYDAWIPRDGGTGMLYVMAPDWEQAYCFTATDPDGDDLKLRVQRQARYGQTGILFSGHGGSYQVHATYLPSYAALMTAHQTGRPLQDTFTLLATDDYGGRSEAFVNVSFDVLNRVPVASADSASTDQEIPVMIPVLANDEDHDGDTLSIAALSQPLGGSVTIDGHQICYVPDAGFVGDDAFSYEAVDGYGGSASADVFVEVIQTDFTPPVINALPDIDLPADVGRCDASPRIDTPNATDNNCTPTVAGVRDDGLSLDSPYPVGTTNILWTARDNVGNESTHTQAVTVRDEQPPVISGCPGDQTVACAAGQCSATVTWSEPTATDNCAGELPYHTRSHSPGSRFDVGTTHVAYAFRDAAGNTASCAFDITVLDVTAPTISCPADITVDAEDASGARVSFATPSATDDCDTAVFVSCSPSSGSWFRTGTTTVMCTAEDAGGNTDACTFRVTVEENQPPTARDDNAQLASGQGIIIVDVLANDDDRDGDDLTVTSASAACGYARVSGNRVEYGTLNCMASPGSTVAVAYTISDGRGGTDSATLWITLPGVAPRSAEF